MNSTPGPHLFGTAPSSPMHANPAGSDHADEVILVNDRDEQIGTADRLGVHDTQTPLHRAFSLHLFNEHGQALITRRALNKATWPGVWTNACCGHPRPGEEREQAVHRRLAEELGVEVTGLELVLPHFRYRAVDASGLVENEICPVFIGRIVGDLHPDPDEVAEYAWVPWHDLVVAARATPTVYSPWSVSQLEQLHAAGVAHGGEVASSVSMTSVDHTLTRVQQLLDDENASIQRLWQTLAPQGLPDVLGDDPGDLPDWMHRLRGHGGKSLRTRMIHWGFIASGGRVDTPGHELVVRSAAALETLHLFALIHDDVMDSADTRRGLPAAHVVAKERFRAQRGRGSARRFGENIAILLGDLAHCEADRLAHTLPRQMRDHWYELELELIAGQRADLTGAAVGRVDKAHAEKVAALKSGSYTIERPLQFGALAAGASLQQRDVLARFGWHLGRAFAWRDDVLGVWGETATTGKPVGDDLREAKATLIWGLGRQRLTGRAAEAMTRAGTASFDDDDVTLLQEALTQAGVRDELERRIAEELRAGLDLLQDAPLTAAGVEGLRAAAEQIVWRDS